MAKRPVDRTPAKVAPSTHPKLRTALGRRNGSPADNAPRDGDPTRAVFSGVTGGLTLSPGRGRGGSATASSLARISASTTRSEPG